jgi:L-glyceraldehyde 3-phosphate reductase
MLNRWIEDGLTRVLDEEGISCIVFSPLAQGQLTSRYLKDVPADSRAAKDGFLKTDQVRSNLPKIQALSAIAKKRVQSLAQMAIAWVLRLPSVTSALLGASSVAQLEETFGLSIGWSFPPKNSGRSNRSWVSKHSAWSSINLTS